MQNNPIPSVPPSTDTKSTVYRTAARDYPNPVSYTHPHVSMARLADLLALRYDANRTAISDARIQAVTHDKVFFGWKDRADHNRSKSLQLPGVQFLERYFHHVLRTGLRSVRYYGFCHSAAKAARLRIQLGLGATVDLGATDFTPPSQPPTQSPPSCPFCNGPTLLVAIMKRNLGSRGPPYTIIPVPQPSAACA